MLAAFYWVIDVRGYKLWSLPLAAVGANSIAIYVMYQLMKPFILARYKRTSASSLCRAVRTTCQRPLRSGRALAHLPLAVQAEDLLQDLNGGQDSHSEQCPQG